jgi:hypothetical protein
LNSFSAARFIAPTARIANTDWQTCRHAFLPQQEFTAIKTRRSRSLIRLDLLHKCHKRDWRKLPFDDIHHFLVFLFGENPGKNGNGIRVMQDQGRWKISFKGNLLFGHDIVDGRPHDLPARKFVTYFNKWLKPLAVQKKQKRVVVTRQT